MRRLLMLLLAGGLLTFAGGCASAGSTGAPGSPAAVTVPPLTVTRTGGVAGVHDALQIEADGRWALTPTRESTKTGQLDAAAAGRLTQLLADPGLDAEIAAASGNNSCADQFRYHLTTAGRDFGFDDCGKVGPLLTDLLGLLREQTGF